MIDLRNTLFAPDSAKSDILNNVGIAASPFTGGVQVVELPGARWKLTFQYDSLSAKYGRQLKAIKAMLRGGAEIAHIYDLSYLPRRDSEPGTPIVNGANQAGGILVTSGWLANTDVLEIGDQVSYLSTDGMYRMHMVTATVTSNASGVANIPILPPLRNPPVNGSSVSSIQPSVTVMLTDGGEVSIDGMLHSATLVLTEALYGTS